jgi:hypothetical protein
VGERRRGHVGVAHRKTAADIDDVDRNAAIHDRLAGQGHCARIGVGLETLRADMKSDAETGGVRPGCAQQLDRVLERRAEFAG